MAREVFEVTVKTTFQIGKKKMYIFEIVLSTHFWTKKLSNFLFQNINFPISHLQNLKIPNFDKKRKDKSNQWLDLSNLIISIFNEYN